MRKYVARDLIINRKFSKNKEKCVYNKNLIKLQLKFVQVKNKVLTKLSELINACLIKEIVFIVDAGECKSNQINFLIN